MIFEVAEKFMERMLNAEIIILSAVQREAEKLHFGPCCPG